VTARAEKSSSELAHPQKYFTHRNNLAQ